MPNLGAQTGSSNLPQAYAKQKALFIYGFTKYIQWPNNQELESFTIGVLGKDKMLAAELRKVIQQRTFMGKPIYVRQFSQLSNIVNCQIVYVDHELTDIAQVVRKIGGKPILLVSDGHAYTSSMISFVLVDDNINYMVNSTRLKNNGFKYSSELIKLSTSLEEWRENYASVIDNLINTKQLSNMQQSEIDKLLLEQNTQQKAIARSKRDLALQQEQIRQQRSQLESLVGLNVVQKERLTQKVRVLNQKDTELKTKGEEIFQQELEVMLQNERLNRQLKRIEFQKKRIGRQKNVMQKNEEKIESQSLQLNISLIVLFIIAMLSAVVAWAYREKRKANMALEQKNMAIESQKTQIERKNKEITSSINYAKKIQEVTLPKESDLHAVLERSFVVHMPKDIVSGDFYWMHESFKTGKVIAAVVDCTGHGVPGAFMSLIGFTLLNQIIIQEGEEQPDEILNKLRKGVVNALQQKGADNEAKDGMDLAICVFDFKKMQLSYAGARNPFYLIRNGELHEFKASSMGIGYEKGELSSFKKQEISIQKGDQIYLFTDGFADQRGGFRNKKYYYKPFRAFLTSMATRPTQEQKEKIEQEFLAWKGENYQVDDVCIMGIEII